MNALDWLLVVLVLAYALSGYWQGFVTGAFATAGLLLGGLFGVWLAPVALGDADPSLLVAVRRQYGIWQDRVERESRDPVDATVARLAADGLWLAELLGMGPPTGELREQVLGRLSALAEPLD